MVAAPPDDPAPDKRLLRPIDCDSTFEQAVAPVITRCGTIKGVMSGRGVKKVRGPRGGGP